MSQLFSSEPVQLPTKTSMEDAPMGERLESTGRYKMPLQGGEAGTKGGGDWVPRGLQSMTNLASSISDARNLAIWQIEQALIGIACSMQTGRGLVVADLDAAVKAAVESGVNLQALRDSPGGQLLKAQLANIYERALNIGGGNSARDAGIERHDVWEGRVKTQLFSADVDPEIVREITALEELLAAAGLKVISSLSERVVRNSEVDAAGRFDNVLLHEPTGRFLMADLKTKRKKFWSMLEIDAQLAGYAYSDLMLDADDPYTYVPGPKCGVDLKEGVVLHMPSDGGEPRLRRADLTFGWHALKLARQVGEVRSYGSSASRFTASYWPV